MGRRRDFSKSAIIKQTVNNLRKNQTGSEAVLWQALPKRKLKGKKFLRQHPRETDFLEESRFLKNPLWRGIRWDE